MLGILVYLVCMYVVVLSRVLVSIVTLWLFFLVVAVKSLFLGCFHLQFSDLKCHYEHNLTYQTFDFWI